MICLIVFSFCALPDDRNHFVFVIINAQYAEIMMPLFYHYQFMFLKVSLEFMTTEIMLWLSRKVGVVPTSVL